MYNAPVFTLITGASAGIGRAFADRFAGAGHSLVLVARGQSQLEQVASELVERHGIACVPIAIDLSASDGAARLWERCRELDIDTLVNNAGASIRNDEQVARPERAAASLRLNMVALAELCLRFGGAMAARGGGRVLNVGSMTAFIGATSMIGYGPSKQFVIAYTRELSRAFAPAGVRVSCLVPGLTDTGFFAASGVPLDAAAAKRFGIMRPEDVAELGFQLAFAGPVVRICGARNRCIAWLAPVLPRIVVDHQRRRLHGTSPSQLVSSPHAL